MRLGWKILKGVKSRKLATLATLEWQMAGVREHWSGRGGVKEGAQIRTRVAEGEPENCAQSRNEGAPAGSAAPERRHKMAGKLGQQPKFSSQWPKRRCGPGDNRKLTVTRRRIGGRTDRFQVIGNHWPNASRDGCNDAAIAQSYKYYKQRVYRRWEEKEVLNIIIILKT